MLKLIQMLTSKQKKINTEIYSLFLGRRVASLANLKTAPTFHFIWHIVA